MIFSSKVKRIRDGRNELFVYSFTGLMHYYYGTLCTFLKAWSFLRHIPTVP